MELNMNEVFVCSRDYSCASVRETDQISVRGDTDGMGGTPLLLDRLDNGALKDFTTKFPCYDSDLLSAQDDCCGLVLGLGSARTSFPKNEHLSSGTRKLKKSMSLFGEGLVSESDLALLKLGLSRGDKDLDTEVLHGNTAPSHFPPAFGKNVQTVIVDECSTSSKRKSGGFMPCLLSAKRLENSSNAKSALGNEAAGIHTFHVQHLQCISEPCGIAADGSTHAVSEARIAAESAASEQRSHNHQPKKCRFAGCSKGARGASGLCIAHGGGQRCQKPGCNKGAESRTAYCKAHGGGRRCQELGCTKSAEGKTEYCIGHGGGRRCGHSGCTKAARGRSGLCIKHGGGKRCMVDGCLRSAEGQAGLCISHGGGRRCQFAGCGKGAQGSTIFCKAHGGGKRCIFDGCTKGAEGSTPLCKAHGGGKRCLFEGGGVCPTSVHGGTDYCVAHGGGKRCATPGCTKSARGRTDCCVRHGGGKRCRFDGCGKSAQGSTNLCKAHGGGKRCMWDGGCKKFARGKSGLCAAHCSMAIATRSGSMVEPGIFRGASVTTAGSSMGDDEHTSSGVSSANSECVESTTEDSLRETTRHWVSGILLPKEADDGGGGGVFVVPEGRVHGGGLMSLFGGNIRNGV